MLPDYFKQQQNKDGKEKQFISKNEEDGFKVGIDGERMGSEEKKFENAEKEDR